MLFKIDNYKLLGVNRIQQKEIIDYGVKMIGAPLEWPDTMGEGIKVGIIDTGIDIKHEDLKHNIKEVANFTGIDVRNVKDENGHGTHVAGIIAAEKNNIGVVGVAPKAELYIAKAFDKDGHSDFENIFKSIKWLMSKNVDVINMSFSTSKATKQYQDIIKAAHDQGIVLVCAAGNKGEQNGKDTIGYPAGFEETIAVTAVDINKKRADFSSVGAKAEIAAAGEEIYSCYKDNSYAKLSGTSMATPLIAGAVAILQAKAIKRYKRKLSPEEIRIVLHMYSEDLGVKGRDDEYGFGLFTFGRLKGSDFVNYQPNRIRSRGIGRFFNF
jgi:subtilisin